MKKGSISLLVFLLMFVFVSCGDDKSVENKDEDSSFTDDSDYKEEELSDLESQDDKEVSEEYIDDITIDDADNHEEIQDVEEEEVDEDLSDDDSEEPDTLPGDESDYSCNSQPCSVDEDCGCDASWCVIDDNNVSYAGLTKQTCAKADCIVGDDSTCPPDYTCIKIPAFVLALMPDLPHTVCKVK